MILIVVFWVICWKERGEGRGRGEEWGGENMTAMW